MVSFSNFFVCLFVCFFQSLLSSVLGLVSFYVFFYCYFFFSMDLTRFFSKWEFCRSLAGPLMSFDSARNAFKIGHRFAISQRTRTAFFFSFSFFLFLNARIFSRSIGRKIKKLATPPSAFHTPLLFSIYHFFFFSFCYFFFIRTRHVGHGEFDWLVAVFFFCFFVCFFFKFSGRNWVGVQKKKAE